jgi:predicted amidohydrolase
MMCCSAQITSCWEKPEKTLAKAEVCIKRAASLGAAIIAFPEQFATGWDPCSDRHIQDRSGQIVSALKKYAAEYSIAVLGSFRERYQPLPKNMAFAVDSDGSILAWYAKMHPFTYAHEERYFAAGEDIAVFDLLGMKFGIAICYDLRFASIFHIYAAKGVHGVFVPAAWPASRARHWELFIMARAAENQMYVIGINTVGKTPVDSYSGASMTADPDGTVISRAVDHEELVVSELDLSRVEQTRSRFPVHKDHRTELYHQLHTRK